ncbi:MAG: RimK family alpha-L-glutamate ligase [Bdellovibrionales bacterium]|nr:RimK family alpha-L-glutamate ligase [Bdellovibrionales bacterium]
MRFAILSRNKNLHSIRRLLQEARTLGVECDIINPLDCQLVVDGRNSCVQVGNLILPRYDAILPRIGASITEYGLAVVRHFEATGSFVINPSSAIWESRDKMACLQKLSQAGLPVPASVLARSPRGLRTAVQTVKGLPVVLKVIQGTQGVGVMLVHTAITLGSVLDTLRGLEQDVLMQQFMAEAGGRDYRAFVVGDRVVAAMMRTAPEGEFRSNIHRGGEGTLVKLPKSFLNLAVKATKTVGLRVAGVDIITGKADGKGKKAKLKPMVLEINSSPGFEGIEKATGLNIAHEIVEYMAKEAQKTKNRKRR